MQGSIDVGLSIRLFQGFLSDVHVQSWWQGEDIRCPRWELQGSTTSKWGFRTSGAGTSTRSGQQGIRRDAADSSSIRTRSNSTREQGPLLAGSIDISTLYIRDTSSTSHEIRCGVHCGTQCWSCRLLGCRIRSRARRTHYCLAHDADAMSLI